MSSHLHDLPPDLPIPRDDGGANHLVGMRLPDLEMRASDGQLMVLHHLRGLGVLYFYPRTGRPDQDLPRGWDMIPGARGCTPQSCSFRDHFAQLRGLGVQYVFGVSTQSTDYQQEAAARLHLPFPLLSDENLTLAHALSLPLMEVEGMRLNRRLTMIVRDGVIIRVFYPVFPPDKNVDDVIAVLEQGV
jgi:peroxiredoxin